MNRKRQRKGYSASLSFPQGGCTRSKPNPPTPCVSYGTTPLGLLPDYFGSRFVTQNDGLVRLRVWVLVYGAEPKLHGVRA